MVDIESHLVTSRLRSPAQSISNAENRWFLRRLNRYIPTDSIACFRKQNPPRRGMSSQISVNTRLAFGHVRVGKGRWRVHKRNNPRIATQFFKNPSIKRDCLLHFFLQFLTVGVSRPNFHRQLDDGARIKARKSEVEPRYIKDSILYKCSQNESSCTRIQRWSMIGENSVSISGLLLMGSICHSETSDVRSCWFSTMSSMTVSSKRLLRSRSSIQRQRFTRFSFRDYFAVKVLVWADWNLSLNVMPFKAQRTRQKSEITGSSVALLGIRIQSDLAGRQGDLAYPLI